MKKGFTLIELLVVIAIIGIFVGVAIGVAIVSPAGTRQTVLESKDACSGKTFSTECLKNK